MKIVQITDIHIPTSEEDTYGINVPQNFLNVLQKAQTLQPDHLVISGDLCNLKGDAGTYRWIKSHLDAVDIPYSLLVGNHDDGLIMSEVFDLEELLVGGELFYKHLFGSYTALFLDTGKYVLSDQQLKWLSSELEAIQTDLLIFMHHPPLFGGVPFMDINHALRNKEAVQAILFNHPHPIPIFCGHYHVDKVISQKNIHVHITPSTYFQIDQHSSTFKVDHRRVGCREIVLKEAYWSSSVHYLEV